MSPLLDAVNRTPVVIEDVAFAIAEDAYPRLDRHPYHALLDDLAAPIERRLAATASPAERRAIFTDHVYGTLGFHGNTDDYYDPRNSYLNEVLERRCGIPITLAVVLMALGRRLGLEVEGVAFPGHFLARFGGDEGVFVDPFSDGNVVDPAELSRLAGDVLDTRSLASVLEPVGPKVMAVRMLFNLQHIYERRGDHARALVVCDRLVDLTDAPFHRRDRGLHALALGAAAAAEDDFAAYLEIHPDADDRPRILELLEQARGRATEAAN